jgi:hypothetical protein
MINEIALHPSRTRLWVLDQSDDLPTFLKLVADSSWPDEPECHPSTILSGPLARDPQKTAVHAIFPSDPEKTFLCIMLKDLNHFLDLERQLRAAKFPCVDCPALPTCDCAFDSYNVGKQAQVDCLAAK